MSSTRAKHPSRAMNQATIAARGFKCRQILAEGSQMPPDSDIAYMGAKVSCPSTTKRPDLMTFDVRSNRPASLACVLLPILESEVLSLEAQGQTGNIRLMNGHFVPKSALPNHMRRESPSQGVMTPPDDPNPLNFYYRRVAKGRCRRESPPRKCPTSTATLQAIRARCQRCRAQPRHALPLP